MVHDGLLDEITENRLVRSFREGGRQRRVIGLLAEREISSEAIVLTT